MTGYGPPPGPPAGPPSGPPSGPPGYGPPPGYGGGYGASKPGFDPKSVNPLDWGILGTAVLAFIFSFISFYTADFSASSGCPSEITSQISAAEDAAGSASAWHGFFGWFGVLLALLGAAAIAIALFAPTVKLPVPARLAALGLFVLAAISEILALPITPGADGTGSERLTATCTIEGDVGHGFGYWITLILVIVGAVLAFMRFQQTGGSLNNLGAQLKGGSGGTPAAPYGQAQTYGAPQQQGYQAPPQAPQGYQPPPQQQGYQSPPQQAPQQGGYQQGPPPQQGYQPPPQQQAPQQGGYQQGPPPQQGGYGQQPPQGPPPGYTPPPQQ